jgi:hypothetical protein
MRGGEPESGVRLETYELLQNPSKTLEPLGASPLPLVSGERIRLLELHGATMLASATTTAYLELGLPRARSVPLVWLYFLGLGKSNLTSVTYFPHNWTPGMAI